jgi:hypothetical protein
VWGTFRTPLGRASVPPDPIQLQKAHFCDRHHSANTVATLKVHMLVGCESLLVSMALI